tara:strand:+ start:359 stop:703 length:345 start_codon:yes stop_codon:yes gene_type:complete
MSRIEPFESLVMSKEGSIAKIPPSAWMLLSSYVDITTGMFLTDLDPFRNKDGAFRKDWFNEKGNLKPFVLRGLESLLKLKAFIWKADSDIVRLLGAERFSMAIARQYPTVAYWA